MKSYFLFFICAIIALIVFSAGRLLVFYWLFYHIADLSVDTDFFPSLPESLACTSTLPTITSHYSVTIILIGDGVTHNLELLNALADFMGKVDLSHSMRILYQQQMPVACSTAMKLSDIVDSLTENSSSMWNRDYCPQLDFQPCENIIFTVLTCNRDAALLNDDPSRVIQSTNNSFLWKLDGINSWGSFLIVNSETDENIGIQLKHLEYILQLPPSSLLDVLNSQQRRMVTWNLLKNSLMDFDKKIAVIHGLYVERNALLWYDVIVDANWTREYKRMMYLMTSIEEDMLRFKSTLNGAHSWSYEESEGFLLLSIIEKVKQTNRIIIDLHDDPKSHYPAVMASRLAVEEYFAVFAPFWLPIFVPVIKSVKLLMSM